MGIKANMIKMFKVVHGEVSGSCSLSVCEDHNDEPRIFVMKDGSECWSVGRSDLLFDYVCKTQLNTN